MQVGLRKIAKTRRRAGAPGLKINLLDRLPNAGHLAFGLVSEAGQFCHGVMQRFIGQMRIVARGYARVGMAEEFTYREQIHSALCKRARISVPQFVKPDRRHYTRNLASLRQQPDVVIFPPRLAVRSH